jgi:hypothetical protein
MIGLPYNDYSCLGPTSEILVNMADDPDPVLLELAAQYPTEAQLVTHIRSLPQRDDFGEPEARPRMDACSPPQRIRIATSNPNCFERAAYYVLVMEVNHPGHTYQLATANTPLGWHTFPLKDGRPVVLDPRVTSDCLECGLALSTPGPIAVEPRNAILWTFDMASQEAPQLRNGPSALYFAKHGLRRLLDHGAVPEPKEIDAMGLMFALAERAARRYGTRAIGIARTAARAVADVLDAVLARRNANIDIGGLKFNTPQWLDDTGSALGHVGLDLGSLALRSKLEKWALPAALGLTGGTTVGLIGLLESALESKGRTLGPLAHPPQLATFEKFAAPRTADT